MVIIKDFEYFKPADIEEAVTLKSKYGASSKILAGGTDLIGRLTAEADQPDAVIDLKGIKELKTIKVEGDKLVAGSLVTFTELANSKEVEEKLPFLKEAAKKVASVSIRNRATMAGNICSCVPCMDSAPILTVCEAEIIVAGPQGERSIPSKEWFVAPRETSIKDDEIVVRISIPVPGRKNGQSFIKLGRYKGEDLAQANVAVIVSDKNEYRIAFGSVGPTPIRATKIEELLNGKKLSDELIFQAKELVEQEISPITDIRATKEYRMHMSKIMLERGLKAASQRISGKGPAYGTDLI